MPDRHTRGIIGPPLHASKRYLSASCSVRILDSQHVACTLNQGVLKPSAGPEEGPVAPARELNPLQHTLSALIRAARRGPQPVESLQQFLCVGLKDGRRCDPLRLKFYFQFGRGVLERVISGVMGTKF